MAGARGCHAQACSAGRSGRQVAWLATLLGPALLSVTGQQTTGSLAGKLTDLHSHAIAGAIVLLHNRANGVQVQTTTAKNGAYAFAAIPAGDYWLEARSPRLGRGGLQEIQIDPGHTTRVQTAVAFDAVPGQPAQSHFFAQSPPPLLERSEAPSTPAQPVPPAPPKAALSQAKAESPQEPAPSVAHISAPPQPPASISPASLPAPHPAPSVAPPLLVASAPPLAERSSIAAHAEPDVLPALRVSAVPIGISQAAHAVGAALSIAAAGAVRAALAAETQPLLATVQPSLSPADELLPDAVLPGEQLQQLPFAGRDWASFVQGSETTDLASQDDGQISSQSRPSSRASVDSAPTGLVFGARSERSIGSSGLINPQSSDTAVAEVRVSPATGGPGSRQIDVQTRSGVNGLHAQVFAFDRQNLWNAQNPYTQQIVETAPATATTVPVFTPFSYTPPDRRLTWGSGIGGPLRRNRLFWFAALDGDQRNDPGVATVRHPANFFAQPSNDQMQVLSARLAMPSTNPVVEGLSAYSKFLEALNGLLGEAPRTSSQWTGFARLDWRLAERQRLMLEGTAADQNAPGGGLRGVSEMYGTHSFGQSRADSMWMLARWEAFLTPNLLAVTQGSMEHELEELQPETPSALEQSLNASQWGQLPQIVVDTRYGFTIGNPARFGKGDYPDEHTYTLQQNFDWVHGPLMMKAGFELRHSADVTSRILNHTGTYHYTYVENFISDALVYQQYGLSDALDPMNQHNCDQRGKAWRDPNGQLHGLGYLPCYSYYTQTLGPEDWHLSTNDWGSFGTLQWQPAKSFVVTAGLRWDREQLPPPIALVNNSQLPQTQKLPGLGGEWQPRVGLAWGKLESHWPVVRLGYGMYFGRTSNAVVETALTQTGSLAGDLNFFLRPTDNLLGQGGGAPPFPYVLTGQPGTFEKPGVVEFAPAFRNPEIHQAEAGVEEKLPGHLLLQGSALMSLGRRLPVTMDTNYDPAVNPQTITYAVVDASGDGPLKSPQITVPFFASWPTATGADGRLNPDYQQITQIESRANSTYEGATLDVVRYAARGLSLRAGYTYAHAMDWNPNESALVSGSSVLDPTSFRQEYGTGNLDIRHSATAMVLWNAPWKLRGSLGALANGWLISGTGRFHSGLPYTMRTGGAIPELFQSSGAVIVGLGPSMNGYGGDMRVYGVGRNTYRSPSTWKADLRVGKRFRLKYHRELELMAESFNLFNHQNVTEVETIGYTIEPGSVAGSLPTLNFLTGLKAGQTEFGHPLNVNATDFYRERQIDFGIRFTFGEKTLY